MYVLGIESTCDETAAAIVEDGRKVISNVISTSVKEQALYGGVVPEIASRRHAEYISATVDKALADAGMTMADVDAVAVAKGPGSFTGIRIGVAAAKGFAWGRELPLYGVSTLEAMALGLGELEGLVCPVMDARREQVYNALFRASGGTLTRLREDRAIALADLKEDLQHWAEPVVLVGDGALLCSRTIGAERLRLAPEHRRHQRAAGVALAAWASICRGDRKDNE